MGTDDSAVVERTVSDGMSMKLTVLFATLNVAIVPPCTAMPDTPPGTATDASGATTAAAGATATASGAPPPSKHAPDTPSAMSAPASRTVILMSTSRLPCLVG